MLALVESCVGRHTKVTKRLLLIAALALSGAFAAVLVTSSTAQAWDVNSLPDGYSTAHWLNVSPEPGSCPEGYTVVGFDAAISLGLCDPTFQQQLDAFIDSTCPCARTTAAPTTETTTTPPAPQPPLVTTATTSTEPTATVDDAVAALSARIAELEAQLAALTTRVEKLELAGQAAQLAFDQAVAAGMDGASAADLARATFLNAEYGLGAFAS